VSQKVCPFCGGSDQRCLHFVGEIDHTFGEVSGVRELDNLSQVADNLDRFFKKGKPTTNNTKNTLITDLYSSWQKTGSIDQFILGRFIVSLLLEAGAKRSVSLNPAKDRKVGDSSASMPGFTSSETTLFAASPDRVAGAALEKLKGYLS